MSILFSELGLREIKLCNRIVVSPMSIYAATMDGMPTYWHDMHYGNLAVSGPGLVVVEATYISADGRSSPGDLGLWNARQAAAFADMLNRWKPHTRARFGIQISHAGRKGATPVAWRSNDSADWPIKGPSSLPFDGARPGAAAPAEMTIAEIAAVIDDFRHSAELAVAAGFEYLEILAAHGYLLHSFLSPISNTRKDEYGGNLAQRMRLVIEVCKAVRDVWPAHLPLAVRLSCSDWIDGGWNLDDTLALTARLQAAGCDLIVASSGGISLTQSIPIGPGYQASFAKTIRETGIATLAVGLIEDPKLAEYLIASDHADLIGVARAMIANPRWPWRAAIELGSAIPDHPPPYARGATRLQTR